SHGHAGQAGRLAQPVPELPHHDRRPCRRARHPRIQYRPGRPPRLGGGELSRVARRQWPAHHQPVFRQGTPGGHLQRYFLLEPEPPRRDCGAIATSRFAGPLIQATGGKSARSRKKARALSFDQNCSLSAEQERPSWLRAFLEAGLTLTTLTKLGWAALCALGIGLGATAAQAQTALPPGQIGIQGLPAGGRILVAQADNAQIMVRVQQLEEQIRLLNGQVEGLTFQLTQLQEILNRLQEDSEFRFQQLEGGAGGKTDAATQAGGEMRPEALPQDPATSGTEDQVPLTDIPEQGVQPLPGDQQSD